VKYDFIVNLSYGGRYLMLQLTIHGWFRAEDESGQEIPVKSKKARALLAYLALPPGKPRSREELMAMLWSDRSDEQARGSLRQALSSLRRDLDDDTARAIIIADDAITLDPDLVTVNQAEPGAKLLEGLHINDPSFDDWLRDERLRREGNAPEVLDPPKTTHAARPTIAVLPFDNLSADPEQQYFSDGITEDIMTELSRFGSIDVLARQSGFVLRDKGEDAHEAFIEMGARYLLEGSVRKAGNRIRLTAQLIDADSRKQIWAERYDRELTDIFAIQDELVTAIVTKLAGRVSADGLDRVSRRSPESLDAYDCYLQGLWYDRRYEGESAAKGCKVLERAIALDPGFARAYGLLASLMMSAGWFEDGAETVNDGILRIAKKAVELDPNDGDCYAKLAIIHLDRQEHEPARLNFEKAFELNPHDSYLWCHYSWYLVVHGRAEDALAYLDKVRDADPYPPNWYWDIRAEAHFGLDHYEEALVALDQKAVQYSLNLAQAAACYGHLGEIEKALEKWDEARRMESGFQASWVSDTMGYANQVDADRWTEGLRKAGIEV
jgi:adenylate cyclase